MTHSLSTNTDITFFRRLYYKEMTHMFEIRGAARHYTANRPARGNSAATTDQAGRGRVPAAATATYTAARCCQTSALQIAYLLLPRPCDESDGPLI